MAGAATAPDEVVRSSFQLHAALAPGAGAIQGLISEKSLDEVIHAYLSDDGEET